MYHNNLQQAQQLINSIDQMASQIRQQETTSRQMLSQLEQKEAQVAHKLQQMQQMCQQCSRVLQTHQSYFRTVPGQGNYQQEIMGSPMGISNMGYQSSGINLGQPQNISTSLQTQSPLVDPTTMGASTYYDSLQQFGGSGNQSIFTPGGVPGLQSGITGTAGYGGQGQTGFSGQSNVGFSSGIGSFQSAGVNLGQPQNIGSFLQTQTPLVDPTTMGASTYYDSLQQFGGSGNQSIFTPGGVPGLQSSGIGMGSTGQGGVFSTQGSNIMGQGTSTGINMEISSLPTQAPFASTATMGPDRYQSAAQRLGGANLSMSTVGKQSGISSN